MAPSVLIKSGASGDAASNAQIIATDGQHLALVGASVNAALAVVKILTGAFGHSYALIADGMESGLDVASSLVIWGGLRYAVKSPDADHPYGHGKAEPISALLVSSGLTGAALVLAGLSVREILSPHRALPAWVTLGVLVVVIAVKEALFRRVHAAGKKIASSAVRTEAWHHRFDAITSVAAFTGILIARLGGPACGSADAWAALFACGIIGYNGYRLMLPAIAEIMDSAPDPEIARQVRAAAAAVPGVATVEKCLVRKMGLDFYVDLHVGGDGLLTGAARHHRAHQDNAAGRTAEHRVADVLVHIEPDNVCPYPGISRR